MQASQKLTNRADLEALLQEIIPIDPRQIQAAKARHDTLTKPQGSLGQLESLGIQLASILDTTQPSIRGKAVAVFAADHGVTAEGVSAFPKEVTAQMVLNFLRDGAAVNALSKVAGAELVVVDVGVDAALPDHLGLLAHKVRAGTRNMCVEPAMSEIEVLQALQVGRDVAQQYGFAEADVLVGGEMGIGNTSAASALTHIFTGEPLENVVGRGTGLDDDQLAHKREVIARALALHTPTSQDPLHALACVGGLEISALTGFYLGAAAYGMVVVLDGFITTAAALVAAALQPTVTQYMIASHQSQEVGHQAALRTLGLTPLLNLDMRLGEASGGVLALGLVDSAAAVLREMATFTEASVAQKHS